MLFDFTYYVNLSNGFMRSNRSYLATSPAGYLKSTYEVENIANETIVANGLKY